MAYSPNMNFNYTPMTLGQFTTGTGTNQFSKAASDLLSLARARENTRNWLLQRQAIMNDPVSQMEAIQRLREASAIRKAQAQQAAGSEWLRSLARGSLGVVPIGTNYVIRPDWET